MMLRVQNLHDGSTASSTLFDEMKRATRSMRIRFDRVQIGISMR